MRITSDEVSSVVDDTEISSVAGSSSKTGGSRSRKGGVASSGRFLKSEQASLLVVKPGGRKRLRHLGLARRLGCVHG
jgi:hypothetical protein